jgi:hypothetical protein
VRNSKDIDAPLVANNGQQATLRGVMARVTLKATKKELLHSIHRTANNEAFTALFNKKDTLEAEAYFGPLPNMDHSMYTLIHIKRGLQSRVT